MHKYGKRKAHCKLSLSFQIAKCLRVTSKVLRRKVDDSALEHLFLFIIALVRVESKNSIDSKLSETNWAKRWNRSMVPYCQTNGCVLQAKLEFSENSLLFINVITSARRWLVRRHQGHHYFTPKLYRLRDVKNKKDNFIWKLIRLRGSHLLA